MMATSLFWMASIMVVMTIISHHNCDTAHDQNPQKMVEIIELMLSQIPKESEPKGFGIQKVPQEDPPNYEILITPNKNLQELKGSQKIKIFVEAANFDKEGKPLVDSKKGNEESEKKEKHNIFDVLPLSIETVGLNINQYHQSDIPVVKLNDQEENEYYSQKDFESYPSKRQTNWGATQQSRPSGKTEGKSRQVNIKEVGIQPGYVDQNNPYQPVISTKKEEQPRLPVYDGDYSSSSQNGKRITQQSHVEVYSPEEVRPRPSSKEPKRTYESAYEDNPVYEEVRPSRQSEERRPTYNRPDDNYRPSGSRNPVYEDERRPSYSREETRPSDPRRTYTREPEKTRPGSERYPEYEEERPSYSSSYSREPEDVEPSRERRPTYEKENGGREYEEEPKDNRERPVREGSGYSGFPESHATDIYNHYSKPLQYEPPRAFPASPCLNVFKYEGREPEDDRWYADIYVSTDEVLNGMRLDIRLDKPAEILTNWLAEVKTKDSMHFTLLSLTHKLVPGPPETVRIMVKFNVKKPVPYLKSINLNGRLICPSNRAQKTTTRRPVYENPGDLQQNNRRTTEQYQEGPKRPVSFVEEEESNTKRTTGYTERRPTTPYENTNRRTTSYEDTNRRTTPYEDTSRRTTPRPPQEPLRPNPNGYEGTDQNAFGATTKRPPGRPSHSNGKPPSHAAKPAQGVKPGSSQNKHPTSAPTSNKSPPKPSEVQGQPQKNIPCGTPSVQPRPLITHGHLTSRGQWPWHVALYKNVGTDLTFFCGGSLINSNYVLTAAHCVTKTYTKKPLDENTLVVYLGKYHLKLWSEGGVQNRQVSKIYVHPKYNSTDFKSDIAVLALSSPVEYTDYIRPICLWDRLNTRIEDVEGKEGTVVGWGFDETKKLTEELRQAKMPVIKHETCLWSYPEFYPQFTSNSTYCAGFKNGTSVCNGDSGGGMVFPFKDSNGVERWYLRGIVSISPARNDGRVCDPMHYVVFTDAAKFLPWLDNFV